ncbi:MAG: UDP-N-acetylmuramate--alanine ligase [Burkholderiales bacterium]|nr:UDP-N-acetylmuramate--alanine ligase [Burkholderiales bacterium]
MRKEQRPKQQLMRARLAAAAARIMAEDGIDDFGLAKRKAARQLGASDTHSLPTNEEVEAELRSYQALYQGEEQRERIDELRRIALDAMRELAQFRPYLSGAVLKGTAGRYADIDLQLFTDDPKAVELLLLNRNVPYEIADTRRFAGDEARPVALVRLEWEGVPINVAVHACRDERTSLKVTPNGRPIERAGLAAVEALVAGGSADRR